MNSGNNLSLGNYTNIYVLSSIRRQMSTKFSPLNAFYFISQLRKDGKVVLKCTEEDSRQTLYTSNVILKYPITYLQLGA